MKSERVHVSGSGSAVLGVPVREGAKVQGTGSVRVHGTVKADSSGGDGGNRRERGSAGEQAEYEGRGRTQETQEGG